MHRSPSPSPCYLGTEHVFLGAAIVAITTTAVALIVEGTAAVQVLRGGYSILTGVFVVGCVGWIVGSAERRVRRDLGGAVAELTTALDELRDQVAHQRVTYLPARGRQPGHLYVSGTQAETRVEPPTAGLNPESIAAARALARRIADEGPDQGRRDAE